MTAEHDVPRSSPRPEKRPRTTLSKTIAWLIRLLVYLPVLILLLVALLVGTGIGTHVLVKLADWSVPGLNISYQSGTLNNKLALNSASWRMAGVDVNAEKLVLQWRPACLLQAQLCVDDLHVGKTQVNVNTADIASAADAVAESPAIKELQLPFGIQLKNGQLQDVSVQVNDMHFAATDISLSAVWQRTGLMVETLKAQGLSADIPLNSEDKAVNVTHNTVQSWPLAALPTVSMPFPLNVQSAVLSDSTLSLGKRQDKFPGIDLQGSFIGNQISIQHLTVRHDYGEGTLQGELALSGAYPLTIHSHLNIQQIPQFPGLQQQQVTATLSGDFDSLQADIQLQGDQQADITGKIALSKSTLPYELTVKQGQLHWPLAQPLYSVSALDLQSQGSLTQQHIKVSGNVDTPWVQRVELSSDLTHRQQQLTLTAFKAWSAAGQVTLKGNLDYAKGINWQAQVGLEELNATKITLPANAFDIPESSISGSFSTEGYVDDKRWRVAVSNADVRGSAAKTPFVLTGSADVDQQWHIHSKGLQLTAFNSHLSLDGNAGDKWDLNGQLSIPELAMFYPLAHGSINADINVRGDELHPKLTLNGNAAQLSFKEYALDNASINGHYLPLDQHAFALQLIGKALTVNNQKFDLLTVKTDGDIYQQQVTVEGKGSQSVNAKLANQYDPSKHQLKAKLTEFSLDTPIGYWQLQYTASLDWDLSKRRGLLSPLCLQATDNLVCLQHPVNLTDKGQAVIHYAGTPAPLLANVLPEGITWHGQAKMDASISWQPKSKPTAELLFNIGSGRLTLPDGKGKQTAIDFDGGYIKASLNQQSLTTQVTFTAGDILQLHSQLSIAVTPEHALKGTVKMQRINLQPLQKLLPQLQTLTGLVNADVNIGGTLNEPQFSGQLQVDNAELVSTSNPTAIKQLQLQLVFAGQQATVASHWIMGEGKGQMQGTIRWTDGRFTGDLAVTGNDLTIIQPPLAILKVSPNLQLHVTPQLLDVKGNVSVPSGTITIVQLPDGGINVSQDVVFDDNIAAAQKRSPPMAINADLSVNVGNKVAIDGYGLKGILSGTLRLQQLANKPAQLFGNIRVLDGSYRFMGQTLTITTGELQFVGPPQVPNLNIEAIREIKDEDVVAGVRVTGTPRKPVVTLFSNPTKEQAEILSYIVQGKGYDASQNNSLMLSAAMAISGQVSGGGQALSNIGNTAAGLVEKFGFSNVQLDTDDDGKVAISGYLGKDLMLKYGVGVFTPGYEMTVRYYLLSKLYLESVTSTVGQSLDIYYSFDL
ncbi:translocation/assembly module TamB domain-containing protein [Shewanella sp. A32]|uniref:autotransporter assembly complex protein TamB n=1 Tax=Shewanella sp. A32 TaxID=3031327 RepID=UPI0023B950B1|nr:translocation/assembly module TamB domain-containing protein [Shewanella sp. A32]MDF0534440.1 translocation/assembly module TamB domain-containing protein [Shewanella sp. A32]